MSDLPVRPAPTAEGREQVMDLLSRYFTAGKIEMDEMEHRMEQAARAQTAEELDAALVGLKNAAPHPMAESPQGKELPMGPDRPKGKSATIAIMSGNERAGRWFPAPRHRVVAIMGGVELDFREAELAPGTTDVTVWAFWGGVEIVVPPDLDVEVDGFAIMGGLAHAHAHPAPLEEQKPRLRIHARVLMGGTWVKVKKRRAGLGEDGEALPRKRGRKKLKPAPESEIDEANGDQ